MGELIIGGDQKSGGCYRLTGEGSRHTIPRRRQLIVLIGQRAREKALVYSTQKQMDQEVQIHGGENSEDGEKA